MSMSGNGNAQAARWIERLVERVEPLRRALALSRWEAATGGRSEDYARAAALEIDLRRVYGDAGEFAELERLRASPSLADPLLRRQIDRLYLAFLENQIPADLMEPMVRRSSELESAFNTHRGSIDGRQVTDNEIRDVLRRETRSEARREAWEASKQVGAKVAPLVRDVVRLRNQAARRLGFPDYYAMAIATQEQEAGELVALFDELGALTLEPFRQVKREIDAAAAARCGVGEEELMPWHYAEPFFQEAPPILDYDLNAAFEGRDVVALAREFFRRVGLPADSVLEKSDLYEKNGKEQHAFCIDIDRQGDVRVLANVRDNEQWMETMLHELGHAAYDVCIDRSLPYFLREAAHTFTTEAVAMFFGRRSKAGDFARRLLGLPAAEAERYEEAGRRMLRRDRLVFSRWVQVMMRFEQALYADPEQDLERAWWDLAERHQGLRRPPDGPRQAWASKIHLATHPVYYHNYMLGEMMASQMQRHMARELARRDGADGDWLSFVDMPEVGEHLKERVLRHGARLHWRDLVAGALGEPLSARHFAAQIVSAVH